jgi:hypothetical protein
MPTIFDHLDEEWTTLANHRHSRRRHDARKAPTPILGTFANLDAVVSHL